MSTATIVIATTGAAVMEKALASAMAQDHPGTKTWVVVDGPEYYAAAEEICARHPGAVVVRLPENTGANGFYGHRIYAAVGHLVNTDYVLLLDQDNWMDPNHASSLISAIEANNWSWAHSLRKISDREGNHLCLDDCESLGRWPIFLNDKAHLVDTSCYCIKREAMVAVGSAWHWGWGGDRRFLAAISQHFGSWGTSGLYTLNYRLDGNPGSVTKEFFDQGNAATHARYGGRYPWRR
jgi:GT2 family glycosyltransferase